MENRLLPAAFTDEMRRLLGPEYELFEASYEAPRFNGLRLNTMKMSPEEFEERAPFHLEKVPWAPGGYYYDYRDAPGRHPYYRAGLYYLQEPSAMLPAALLPVSPGDRVLDLCAAPGGKATQLGARLMGEGLLLANEISASRAKALLKNIELFGIRNAFVSNAVPARMEPFFRGYFDKVMLDAPCSGEGMFRKDPDVARAWYPEKVKECAAVQKDLVLRAADMLREGGMMVYSTCTFSPEENELVIAHLLRERPEMELVPLGPAGGREGFAPGFSLNKLVRLGYLTREEAEEIRGSRGSAAEAAGEYQSFHDPAAEEAEEIRGFRDPAAGAIEEIRGSKDQAREEADGMIRLWPHRIRGEGHFAALLRKKGEKEPREAVPVSGRREKRAEKSRKKDRPGKNRKDGAIGIQGPDAEQRRLLEAFLKDFTENIPSMDRVEVHNGQAYLMPEAIPETSGISFLRRGLYLGELKKGRFEPAQELAMALDAHGEDPAGRRISFSPEDDRVSLYLKGETISGFADPEDSGMNGWRLVTVDGLPLGWAKLVGGQLKNKYLLSWRDQ